MIHLTSTLIQAFRNFRTQGANPFHCPDSHLSNRPTRPDLQTNTGASSMQNPQSFTEFLCQQTPGYFQCLPETVSIPLLKGSCSQTMALPLEYATLDDLAFAIQLLEAEKRTMANCLYDLQAYQLESKRGVLGATMLNDAFRNPTESSKEPS